jgi:hypothetical protein
MGPSPCGLKLSQACETRQPDSKVHRPPLPAETYQLITSSNLTTLGPITYSGGAPTSKLARQLATWHQLRAAQRVTSAFPWAQAVHNISGVYLLQPLRNSFIALITAEQSNMRTTILSVGLLAWLVSVVSATALTYKMTANEKACFYANAPKEGVKIAFYFAV